VKTAGTYDAYFVSLVQSGILTIDDAGAIWRTAVFTRVGALKPILPRRAEKKPRKDGYLEVTSGRRKVILAHRLVYLGKHGPIPHGRVVNHKNGIRSDNSPTNLEPMAQAENNQHAITVLGADRSLPGELNPNVKLTLRQVDEIRKLKGIKPSRAVGVEFGVSHRAILDIWQGAKWKKFPHA